MPLDPGPLTGAPQGLRPGAQTYWVPGGNSFGTERTFGTNDPEDLPFVTAGIERMRILKSGQVQISSELNLTTVGVTTGQILIGSLRMLHRGLLASDENNFAGAAAGNVTLTGTANNAFGSLAGSVLGTGTGNSLFGHRTGLALTSGERNTFIGGGAGLSVATGDDNVMIGSLAGSGLAAGTEDKLRIETGEGILVDGNFATGALAFRGSTAVVKATINGATVDAALIQLLATLDDMGIVTDSHV